MTLTGTNFISASIVNFGANANAGGVVTNGGNTLTITIPGNQLTATGPVSVTVMNPTPGGGTTTAQAFIVNNPAPTITTISLTSAPAGGAGVTRTVKGTNFVSGAVVNFNGTPRTTTYVNATQLTASITAPDIASAGTFNVTVTNPAPGGSTSGNSTFTVNNPAPRISSLNPNGATAGGSGFPMTVNGTNFVSGSVVNFNGTPRTTAFVSATQLTATIPASDISAIGSANITVTNPAPGGGTTPNFGFTIVSAPNPVPTLTSISPTSGVVGQPVNMTLTGTNFIAGSIVNFGGISNTGGTPTNGGTTLTITIPANQVTPAGPVSVTVTNPTPGGGTTAAQTFTANNPSPAIATLSPTGATVGGTAFTLTVTGTNFVSTSVANFNGTMKTTTAASATQLTVSI